MTAALIEKLNIKVAKSLGGQGGNSGYKGNCPGSTLESHGLPRDNKGRMLQ